MLIQAIRNQRRTTKRRQAQERHLAATAAHGQPSPHNHDNTNLRKRNRATTAKTHTLGGAGSTSNPRPPPVVPNEGPETGLTTSLGATHPLDTTRHALTSFSFRHGVARQTPNLFFRVIAAEESDEDVIDESLPKYQEPNHHTGNRSRATLLDQQGGTTGKPPSGQASSTASAERKQYWMSDRNVSACYDCSRQFTFFRRRHHCRLCGQIFCGTCSAHSLAGAAYGTEGRIRVCSRCHDLALRNPTVTVVRSKASTCQACTATISFNANLAADRSTGAISSSSPGRFQAQPTLCNRCRVAASATAAPLGAGPTVRLTVGDDAGAVSGHTDRGNSWNRNNMNARDGVGGRTPSASTPHTAQTSKERGYRRGTGGSSNGSGARKVEKGRRRRRRDRQKSSIDTEPGSVQRFSMFTPSRTGASPGTVGPMQTPFAENMPRTPVPSGIVQVATPLTGTNTVSYDGVTPPGGSEQRAFGVDAYRQLRDARAVAPTSRTLAVLGNDDDDNDLSDASSSEDDSNKSSMNAEDRDVQVPHFSYFFGGTGESGVELRGFDWELYGHHGTMMGEEHWAYSRGVRDKAFRLVDQVNLCQSTPLASPLSQQPLAKEQTDLDAATSATLRWVKAAGGASCVGEESVHALEARLMSLRQAADVHLTFVIDRLMAAHDLDPAMWMKTLRRYVHTVSSRVRPLTRPGDRADIRSYMQVHCVKGGRVQDWLYKDGVLVRGRNVVHKKMKAYIESPRIMLLGSALEFYPDSTRLCSFDELVKAEEQFIAIQVSKIISCKPDVVVLQHSASQAARDLLCQAGISLLLNVGEPLIQELARCTGTQILPAADYADPHNDTLLGRCAVFRIIHFDADVEQDEVDIAPCLERNQSARPDTSQQRSSHNVDQLDVMSSFEGCDPSLHCAVVIRGSPDVAVLERVKAVFKSSAFVAHSLILETAYLFDACCSYSDKHLAHLCSDYNVWRKQHGAERVALPQRSLVDIRRGWMAVPLSLSPFVPLNGVVLPGLLADKVLSVCSGNVYTVCRTTPSACSHTDTQQTIEWTWLHRDIIFGSFWLTVPKLGDVPRQCFSPELKGITMYSNDDKTLGSYLAENCFDLSLRCGSEKCRRNALRHLKVYTHRGGRLVIKVNQVEDDLLPSPSSKMQSFNIQRRRGSDNRMDADAFLDDCGSGDRTNVHLSVDQNGHDGKLSPSLNLGARIVSWARCSTCKRNVTPIVPLSDRAMCISFGKFLDLTFFNTAAAVGNITSCDHGQCSYQGFIRFFALGSLVASFEYTRFVPYRVVSHVRLMYSRKLMKRMHLQDARLIWSAARGIFQVLLRRVGNIDAGGSGRAHSHINCVLDWIRNERAKCMDAIAMKFFPTGDGGVSNLLGSVRTGKEGNPIDRTEYEEATSAEVISSAPLSSSLSNPMDDDLERAEGAWFDVCAFQTKLAAVVSEGNVILRELTVLAAQYVENEPAVSVPGSSPPDPSPETASCSSQASNNGGNIYGSSSGAQGAHVDIEAGAVSPVGKASMGSPTAATTRAKGKQVMSVANMRLDPPLITVLRHEVSGEGGDELSPLPEQSLSSSPLVSVDSAALSKSVHSRQSSRRGSVFRAAMNSFVAKNGKSPEEISYVPITQDEVVLAMRGALNAMNMRRSNSSRSTERKALRLESGDKHIYPSDGDAVVAANRLSSELGFLDCIGGSRFIDFSSSLASDILVTIASDEPGSIIAFSLASTEHAAVIMQAADAGALEGSTLRAWCPYGDSTAGSEDEEAVMQRIENTLCCDDEEPFKHTFYGMSYMSKASVLSGELPSIFPAHASSCVTTDTLSSLTDEKKPLSDRGLHAGVDPVGSITSTPGTEKDASGKDVMNPQLVGDESRRSGVGDTASGRPPSVNHAASDHVRGRAAHRVSFVDNHPDGTKFLCTTYFPRQFHALRRVFCGGEYPFVRSLSRCHKWDATGGKSGSTFGKSIDDRFVLKYVSRKEATMFLDVAPRYFAYMAKHFFHRLPTLLIKTLGVYQLSWRRKSGGAQLLPGSKLKMSSQYVFVMPNLMYNRTPSRIFDLKGSLRNRYVKDDAVGTGPEISARSSQQRPSPLVGKVPGEAGTDVTGKGSDNAGNDDVGTHKVSIAEQSGPNVSVRGSLLHNTEDDKGPSGATSQVPKPPPTDPVLGHRVLLDQNLVEYTRGHPIPIAELPHSVLQMSIFNDTLFLAELGVVDYSMLVGVDEGSKELFVGIIDYVRQWTWDKRLETGVKSVGMIAGRSLPTVISPQSYKMRFRAAMDRYFAPAPEQSAQSGVKETLMSHGTT